MGDFDTIDDVTADLLRTLERLKLYDGVALTMQDLMRALQAGQSNFGKPSEIFLAQHSWEDLERSITFDSKDIEKDGEE